MRVYLKTINGELDGAYFVHDYNYKIMCRDSSWKVRVYCEGYGEAFMMEQDAYKVTPTHTSSSTVTFYYHSGMGTGSSGTGQPYTYTHFRYIGRLGGKNTEFKSLGEMIDVMCTKHRMLK